MIRLLARIAWGVCALACLGAIAATILAQVAPRGAPVALDPLTLAYGVLLMVGYPLLTGLILNRQPDNTIGWLLLVPQFSLATGSIAQYFFAAYPTAPTALAWPVYIVIWYLGVNWIVFVDALALIPVFFPTGQPPSGRWWWLVAAMLVHAAFFIGIGTFAAQIGPAATDATWTVTNPIGFITDAQIGALLGPWFVALSVLVVLALTALFVRYRRAGEVVQTQIRWLLFASSLFVLIYVPQLILPLETPTGQPTVAGIVLNIGFALSLLAIPAAIAIAILRYRLWDIDVLIRRTLIYSVLSAVLALAYFGSVLVLQNVFQAVTGEGQNALVTVLSTLLIAALFIPLRGRVQRAIDRRFYRQKYDAARTLAAFGAQARDVVALEQLSEQLITAVDKTMQPAHVGLWVRRETGRLQEPSA